MSSILTKIVDAGLVAVARITDAEDAVPLVGALLAGGISNVEFTLSHRNGLACLERAREHWGERATIGMGTVLDPESARSSILAGAQFVVTPSLNTAVIQMCRRYSVPVVPGALTPTEIVTAWEAGADVVKVFPASAFGPRYLRELNGPLPQIKLMPSGGVGPDNIADYLSAGAVAVSVGGSLVAPALVQSKNWDEITERARQLVAVAQQAGKGTGHA